MAPINALILAAKPRPAAMGIRSNPAHRMTVPRLVRPVQKSSPQTAAF